MLSSVAPICTKSCKYYLASKCEKNEANVPSETFLGFTDKRGDSCTLHCDTEDNTHSAEQTYYFFRTTNKTILQFEIKMKVKREQDL